VLPLPEFGNRWNRSDREKPALPDRFEGCAQSLRASLRMDDRRRFKRLWHSQFVVENPKQRRFTCTLQDSLPLIQKSGVAAPSTPSRSKYSLSAALEPASRCGSHNVPTVEPHDAGRRSICGGHAWSRSEVPSVAAWRPCGHVRDSPASFTQGQKCSLTNLSTYGHTKKVYPPHLCAGGSETERSQNA
jgi:hypothetical protein